MVWKNQKYADDDLKDHFSKKAKEVQFNPLFSHAKTMPSKDMKVARNCKIVTEKEVKGYVAEAYQYELDHDRRRQNKKRYAKYRQKDDSFTATKI